VIKYLSLRNVLFESGHLQLCLDTNNQPTEVNCIRQLHLRLFDLNMKVDSYSYNYINSYNPMYRVTITKVRVPSQEGERNLDYVT
jgi:hypothetical protein